MNSDSAPGSATQAERDDNDNNIGQMERPDERDLTENPMILSLTQSVGDCSFIDER